MSLYLMQHHLNIFRKYLRPVKFKFGFLAVLIVTGIGLQLANPQILRYFIDILTTKGNIQLMLKAGSAFVGISLLIQLLGIFAVYLGEEVGWRATNQLRADLILHCLKLDMSFHTLHTPGEMVERIDGDLLALANFFSRFAINILGNGLLLIGALVTLAAIDLGISGAVLAYLVLGVLAMLVLQRVGVPFWKTSRQASANVFGLLEEQLSSTEDIRSCGAEAYAIRKLFEYNESRQKADVKSATANASIFMVWIGLYAIGQIMAVSVSYSLLQTGQITIGVAYLILYFTFFVFQRLSDLANEIQNLQQAVASLERVQSVLALKSKIESPPTPVAVPEGSLGISFDKVTFSYSEHAPVLRDVSFRLPSGKTMGVLGRTGSGKTTLTRLLFRLYDPNSGTISLETTIGTRNTAPVELRHVALDHLRQRIAMVTQNVQLFDASVRDNVTIFNKEIVDENIVLTLAELGLSEWLASLPQGLDTNLKTASNPLSAGEAQLIAFARVFLGDPGLVILDEASSRLDPVTEQRIDRAIDKMLENRTGIIVAHRLRTVERVDYITIIESGQVLEFGERISLASNHNSHYYRLLQTGLKEVLV